MKKYFLFAVVAFFSVLSLSLESCKEDADPCEEVLCQNGGTCDLGNCNCEEFFYGDLCEDKCVRGKYENGACECNRGYEGITCENEMREQYIGSWEASETCQGQSQVYTYNVGVTENEDDIMQITLSNFRNEVDKDNVVILVDLEDKDAFVIEEQPWEDFTLTGDGGFNATGDTVTLNYKLTNSNGADICTIKMFNKN